MDPREIALLIESDDIDDTTPFNKCPDCPDIFATISGGNVYCMNRACRNYSKEYADAMSMIYGKQLGWITIYYRPADQLPSSDNLDAALKMLQQERDVKVVSVELDDPFRTLTEPHYNYEVPPEYGSAYLLVKGFGGDLPYSTRSSRTRTRYDPKTDTYIDIDFPDEFYPHGQGDPDDGYEDD